MIASPEQLRGVARSLRATKGFTESDRSSLQRAGSVFDSCHSPAADDVKTTLYPLGLTSMEFVIHDFEDLASMLDRAADDLTQKLARIKSIESHARAWFATQPPPTDGSLPRWEREWWQYRPGRFPASGDSAWLAAGPYLHARGVSV